MKIAYIDPHPVPGLTPSTMQMLQTVDGIGQAGVDVTLITPVSLVTVDQIIGRELSCNVKLMPQFDLRRKWYFPFSTHKPFFWQAKKIIKCEKFDALLVRNLKLADYLLRQSLDVKIYFETHEIFAQNFKEEHPNFSSSEARKYKLLREREHYVYNNAAGVFALTSLLVEDIKRDYGANNTKFCILPDGFDPTLADAAREKFIKLGRKPGPPRVLYLGSLHPWKGVNTLVEAMAKVPPPTECWIAGGEPHRIDELKQLAMQIGVADRVHFLGKVPPLERFDLIAQADICALPLTETSIASRYTSPLKLFEYMAMGKPIVAADLPSIREVLSHGEDALLFSVEVFEEMATSIALVVDELSWSQKIGDMARGRSSDFSWKNRGRIAVSFIHGF